MCSPLLRSCTALGQHCARCDVFSLITRLTTSSKAPSKTVSCVWTPTSVLIGIPLVPPTSELLRELELEAFPSPDKVKGTHWVDVFKVLDPRTMLIEEQLRLGFKECPARHRPYFLGNLTACLISC